MTETIWLTDPNGNRASVEYFGSREAAQAALDSLQNCENCTNWEHVEPANLARTLSNIAACAGWVAYSGIAWVRKPGEPSADWARIFLHTTQGGGYTGQAHALVWERGPYRKPPQLIDAVVQAAVQAVHGPKAPAGNLAAAVLAMEALKHHEMEPAMPTAWLLSICKHEIIDSSTPQGRLRGWHPAHCSKCGINLSVDSSD